MSYGSRAIVEMLRAASMPPPDTRLLFSKNPQYRCDILRKNGSI